MELWENLVQLKQHMLLYLVFVREHKKTPGSMHKHIQVSPIKNNKRSWNNIQVYQQEKG